MKERERILVVGSLNVVFMHSYAISFAERGFDVLIVDIGVNDAEYHYLLEKGVSVVRWSRPSEPRRILKQCIKKLATKFGLDRSRVFTNMVDYSQSTSTSIPNLTADCRDLIVNFSPDHVMYGWSTTVRAHKLVLDEIVSDDVTMSLIVNTYPVRENFSVSNPVSMTNDDISFFSSFGLILHTSAPMHRLFSEMGYNNHNSIIHDDRLHWSYFSDSVGVSLPPKSSKRRVVFLGNTNFNERSIDDVQSDLVRMLDAGIEVAIQRPGPTIKIDCRFSLFDPFTYKQMACGELSKFIATFDFVYMGYNNMSNARTAVSFPTRFALAMTGNIPILLEKDNWAGVKAAVADIAQICEFDDLDHCVELVQEQPPSLGAINLSTYRCIFDENFMLLTRKMGIGK